MDGDSEVFMAQLEDLPQGHTFIKKIFETIFPPTTDSKLLAKHTDVKAVEGVFVML